MIVTQDAGYLCSASYNLAVYLTAFGTSSEYNGLAQSGAKCARTSNATPGHVPRPGQISQEQPPRVAP